MSKTAKLFHSKEKALEYIRENKPSISYKELCDFIGHDKWVSEVGLRNRFNPKQ